MLSHPISLWHRVLLEQVQYLRNICFILSNVHINGLTYTLQVTQLVSKIYLCNSYFVSPGIRVRWAPKTGLALLPSPGDCDVYFIFYNTMYLRVGLVCFGKGETVFTCFCQESFFLLTRKTDISKESNITRLLINEMMFW